MPVKPENDTVATLRMELGGKANAEVWHKRLGHIGSRKLKQMIKGGSAPKSITGYDTTECETCQLTRPMRRPVPKKPENSGKVTVQVDYMPMGHDEKGWKGEVGSYVYSHRPSKLVKVYPMNNAATEEAIKSLKKYGDHNEYTQ